MWGGFLILYYIIWKTYTQQGLEYCFILTLAMYEYLLFVGMINTYLYKSISMDDGKAVNLVINLDDGERLETRKVKKSKNPNYNDPHELESCYYGFAGAIHVTKSTLHRIS